MEISLTIDSLAHGGSGVGRHQDLVVFVPFTVPGDQIQAEIISLKKNYAEGKLVSIVKSSPHRVTPPCPVFGQCGGCQWQNVSYQEQLKQKQLIVTHALSRIAQESQIEILPIIPSPQEFFYRNRAQFRTEGPHVGFYQKQSHNIIEFDECRILEKSINEELKKLKKEVASHGEFKTSKVEIYLSEKGNILRSTNKSHGEELGFSQVNTAQNTQMRTYVETLLGAPQEVDRDNVGSRGNLLDLYCGNGNFSLPLNKKGWRIYGIDNNRHAIQEARKRGNQETFYSADDVAKGVHKLALKSRKFETVILDPPRVGAEESLFQKMGSLDAQKLVYISCNPATFARDWARIKNKTPFKLLSVQPFDMFPQTFHVELVALATC